MPKNQSGFNLILLIIIITIVIGLSLGFYFISSKKTASGPQPAQPQEVSTPTNEATSSSAVEIGPEGWIKFQGKSLTFWYPQNYTAKEIRENVFGVFPDDKTVDNEDFLIRIDASRSYNNTSFDQAYTSIKNLLHNETIEEIPNGVKVFGYTVGGYGESLPRRITLIKENDAAIHIQTTTVSLVVIEVYDKLIDSIKLDN